MIRLTHILTAAFLILTLSIPLAAQQSTTDPSKLVLKDSLITVIPWRSTQELAAGIDHAKVLLLQAEGKRMAAQNLSSYTQARIELKQKEIDLIDKRIDIADDAKNEAEASSLKREMQVAKNLLDILKSQGKIREAEMELAAADYDYAGALQIALETEQQLAKQRADYSVLASAGGAEAAKPVQMINELIGKTLEAQLETSKKEQKCADRKRDLTAQRIKLHELQQNFTTNPK